VFDLGGAEYIRPEPRVLWRVPENIPFEQAAAIGGIPLDTAVRLNSLASRVSRLNVPVQQAQGLYDPKRLALPLPSNPSKESIPVRASELD
jgi:hypothetical protein